MLPSREDKGGRKVRAACIRDVHAGGQAGGTGMVKEWRPDGVIFMTDEHCAETTTIMDEVVRPQGKQI